MTTNNKDVITAWANNRPASTKNLRTDGRILQSYALTIGNTIDGVKIVWDYTGKDGRSQTTSRHVNRAKVVAGRVVPAGTIVNPTGRRRTKTHAAQ